MLNPALRGNTAIGLRWGFEITYRLIGHSEWNLIILNLDVWHGDLKAVCQDVHYEWVQNIP